MRLAVGIELQQVDRCRRRLQEQAQCGLRRVGDAGRPGEVVGGAQRQQAEGGQRVGGFIAMRQRGRDFAQRAITTAGDDSVDAVGDRLGHLALGIATFPGDPHVESHTGLAQGTDGLAHGIVASGFAVEDQSPAGCGGGRHPHRLAATR